MKFSDIYIDTKIIKEIKMLNDIPDTIEYEERKIKPNKILIFTFGHSKELYYVWGNIAYAMLLDYKCNNNINIMKIKDLCFHIEKLIKHGDFDIVTLDIKNVLLPLLDKLTIDEINIIKEANRIAAGPLYEYQPFISTPQIFIDLFNHHHHNNN